jgi:hypothetical protein
LFNAQEASNAVERWPVSVDIDAKPERELVSISFQLIPPPNPPFPDAMNRLFHDSGRKRPKLKEELGEDTTFTDIAQSVGSLVLFAGNSGEGCAKEPFDAMEAA